MINLKNYRFLPINFCIYCERKSGKFTDEHIVPFSLGGNIVLPKATCKRCQEITKLFTERLTRKTYYPIRVRMGVQSRTNKNDHPKNFPVWVQTNTGFTKEVRIPAELFPRTYHVPVLGLPTGITGVVDPTYFKAERRESRSDIDDLYEHGLIGPDEFFLIREDFSTVDFFRQLAQIGHAYMFAILRGKGAIPVLDHLIIGPGRPGTKAQPELPKGPWYDYQNYIGGVESSDEINEILKIDIVKGYQSFMVRVRFRMPIEQGWDFPTYQILSGWIPHPGILNQVQKILSDNDLDKA